MSDALVLPGLVLPERRKLIVPSGPIIFTPQIEEIRHRVEKPLRDAIDVVLMAGSLSNYASKSLYDLLWGKTAYAGETTIFGGLWTAALDDTFTGATANEAAYTSYARLSLTNNTTIFAAGSGTTVYTKTFPSDSLKSWAASTGGTPPVVIYLGWLNGNAGSSADKGIAWCSVTSVTINTGDTPQIAQNAQTATLD